MKMWSIERAIEMNASALAFAALGLLSPLLAGSPAGVTAWAMQIARRRGMQKAIVALARRLAADHAPHLGGRHEFRWTREQAAAAA
jgi:hypothetical protein